ncbi:MAG: hemolysin III family protein [Treponema sp.]|jgi:hemolysin III|nr:hemolysin III family protein [Treponema sp.]
MKKTLNPIPPPLPFQTPGEEIANAILHGLGIVLAAAGLVLLTLRSSGALGGAGLPPEERPLAIACCAIYAAMMILMFLSSTLYHAIQAEGAKRVFRVIDHSTVFLLIAGAYTPFSLLGLRGAWGWAYFGTEWALAAAGVSLYAAGVSFLRRIELGLYVLMGWAIVLALFRLYHRLPPASFVLLVAGGVAYTAGVFWYLRRHRRLSHVIWHVHVIAGSVCHWFALFLMLGVG